MEENKDLEQEEMLEDRLYTVDEIQEIIEQVIPSVCMNLKPIQNLKFDKEEFEQGIKEASRYAGFFTTLRNAGMSEDFAYQVLINRDTGKHNIMLTEKQNVNIERAMA